VVAHEVTGPEELLEWFRVDRGKSTRGLLVTGTIFVFFGAGLVTFGFVTHGQSEATRAVALLGAAMLVFGLVLAFGGMTVLLARDEYLAIRADGIVLHHAAGETVHPWPSVSAVSHDATLDAIVLIVDGQSVVIRERYSGATPGELSAHLEELRRKATVGALDHAQVQRIALGLPHRRPR
jgi:hypothetical protein